MYTSAISAEITPEFPVPLFGRGNRPGNFESVLTGLEINLLAFHDDRGLAVIIAIDTLFSSTALKAAVEERAGAQVCASIQAMIFVASHTHHAPALDPTKPKLGKVDPAYLAMVAGRVAEGLT